MNNIISMSGGKDSTAMLHLMLEHNEPIHSVIFFDTGWEFPQMYDHLDLIERKTGIEIVRLKPEKSFLYWMLKRAIISKKTGKIHRIGNGWPSPMRRWCTREKVDVINKFTKLIDNPVSCIGYAYDELDRQFHDKTIVKRFPLIEYRFTEKMALNYCFKLGYHWGGLYKIFDRVSCFCCPLQGIKKLKKLRYYFPGLWTKMLQWDQQIQENTKKMNNPHNWGWFHQYCFLSDIEKSFVMNNCQLLKSINRVRKKEKDCELHKLISIPIKEFLIY